MTGSQVIDWVFANVDLSKLTCKSKIVLNVHLYNTSMLSDSAVRFYCVNVDNDKVRTLGFSAYLSGGVVTGKIFTNSDGNSRLDSRQIASGQKISVYY